MEEQEKKFPQENNPSSSFEKFMILLAEHPIMSKSYVFWVLLCILSGGVIFAIYIITLQYQGEEAFSSGTSLLEMLITGIFFLWIISFIANQQRKSMPAIDFIEQFYENYSERYKNNIKVVKKGRFSLYKNLLQYKDDIYIGIHLEGDNFYIYTNNKDMHQKLKDNGAKEIDNKNVGLNKAFEPTYEGRIKMLDKYVEFVNNTIK